MRLQVRDRTGCGGRLEMSDWNRDRPDRNLELGPTEPAMTPTFWHGVAQFNAREFYACHDTFESLWMAADTSERQFYQGLLQIAVGCYHLGNENWRGAAILLGEGCGRLEAYLPQWEAIDVEQLLDDSAELLAAVQAAGPEGVSALVRQLDRPDGVSLPRIARAGSAEEEGGERDPDAVSGTDKEAAS